EGVPGGAVERHRTVLVDDPPAVLELAETRGGAQPHRHLGPVDHRAGDPEQVVAEGDAVARDDLDVPDPETEVVLVGTEPGFEPGNLGAAALIAQPADGVEYHDILGELLGKGFDIPGAYGGDPVADQAGEVLDDVTHACTSSARRSSCSPIPGPRHSGFSASSRNVPCSMSTSRVPSPSAKNSTVVSDTVHSASLAESIPTQRIRAS